MKRLLSIDGGGIRGLLPAMILADLEKRIKGPLWSKFDLIAGTSTGAILGLGLCHPAGFTAGDCRGFYLDDGPTIFARPWSHRLWTGFGLWGSMYPAGPIEAVLKRSFGDAKFYEARTRVMALAFDYTAYQTDVLKSWEKPDMPFRDAARASSAAPIYFPPHPFGDALYVDGGIFAADPTICAIIEMQKLWPGEQIIVISMGCGAKESPKPDSWNDGISGVGTQTVEAMMDASGLVVDYQANMMLSENYYRISPVLGKHVAMDDASSANLKFLSDLASSWIADNEAILDNISDVLMS